MRRKTLICGIVAVLASGLQAQETRRTVTVEDLFSLLEDGNAALQVQKSGVEVAERSLVEAKGGRLPEVTLSASATYNGDVVMMDRDFSDAVTFPSPHFGNSFALSAEQVVYAGGTVSNAVNMARTQLERQGLVEEQVRQQQRFLALGKCLELLKIDNDISVYEKNLELCRALIADAKALLAEGMALHNDVVRYELQQETISLGLQKLKDSREMLNHQLCNALGISDEDLVPDPSMAEMSASDEPQSAWQDRARDSSLSLRLSGLDVETANLDMAMAKGRRLPSFSVFAADNLSGPFTYDVPPIDNNFNVWYVGVSMRYPISTLFKGGRSVRKAEAKLMQSQNSVSATAKSVDDSMNEAYVLYRQAFVELRTREKSVELATANYGVVNERYLNQLALVTDMVDAANMKLEAELEEVNAKVNIAYAYYKMKYIAGEI